MNTGSITRKNAHEAAKHAIAAAKKYKEEEYERIAYMGTNHANVKVAMLVFDPSSEIDFDALG